MIKNPMNCAIRYVLHHDVTYGNEIVSEEVFNSESKQAALAFAKKHYGETASWHLMEVKVVACSDKADRDRNERLGYSMPNVA